MKTSYITPLGTGIKLKNNLNINNLITKPKIFNEQRTKWFKGSRNRGLTNY